MTGLEIRCNGCGKPPERIDAAEANRANVRRWARKLKSEMIAAYGGQCACCGERSIEFLTLDHINGGGRKHREELGGGNAIARDLKRRGWPKDGYRLLCANCNSALAWFGYCPHRRAKVERAA
jgi:hypothetical protein